MLLESKRNQLTNRDDLRYTDVVIATLQCEAYEPWLKAALLHVPDSDIAYHMQEVDGISSNGAQALTLSEMRDYQRISARLLAAQAAAEAKRERTAFVPMPDKPLLPNTHKAYTPFVYKTHSYTLAPKSKHVEEKTNRVYNRRVIPWSTDREYYKQRTVPQIAVEMGVSMDYTYTYLRRNGFTYKPQINIRNGNGRGIDTGKSLVRIPKYPVDAEWYSSKTCQEAAATLGVSYSTMHQTALRKGFRFKTVSLADINNANFPYLPEWYAEKTIIEIAQILGYSKDKCRHYLKTRGIQFKQREPYKKDEV